MGAELAERYSFGKSAAEAYRRAVANAQDEVGHQEGYSGDINSGGHGFTLVTLPPRFTYQKFQALLEDYEDSGWRIADAQREVQTHRPGGFRNESGKVRGSKGNLRKAEAELKKATARRERLLRNVPAEIVRDLDGLAAAYSDKWGDYLAVEIRGAEAKRHYGYDRRRRGERLYVFFGYAPS